MSANLLRELAKSDIINDGTPPRACVAHMVFSSVFFFFTRLQRILLIKWSCSQCNTNVRHNVARDNKFTQSAWTIYYYSGFTITRIKDLRRHDVKFRYSCKISQDRRERDGKRERGRGRKREADTRSEALSENLSIHISIHARLQLLTFL